MGRCLVAVTFQLCALSRSFLNLLIPGASYDFCEAFAFCCPYRSGAPRGYIRTYSDSPVIMDLVAWRGKAKGGQLRSFLDSTNRSAYRIKYKQGSLLTLLVAYVGGKEGGIGRSPLRMKSNGSNLTSNPSKRQNHFDQRNDTDSLRVLPNKQLDSHNLINS
ncbi:hypothetical protein WN943_020424 [Citrus x changshan-huyou]